MADRQERPTRKAAAQSPAESLIKTENASVTKILDGTLRAIGRRGIRKLSMNDISEAAGVSRGTLYRYFPSKKDALEAVGEHISLRFETDVVEAARRCATPREVLETVMRMHFLVTLEQEATKLVESEPLFVMHFLRSHLQRHVAAISSALAPVYDEVEERTGFALDRMLCSEALVRLQLSTMLVPGGRSWGRMPVLLQQFMTFLMDDAARQGSPSTKPVDVGVAASGGRPV